MLRFIKVLARYIAAIFIAFVVSMVALLFSVFIMGSLESWGLSSSLQEFGYLILMALIGYSGVYAGSLFLEPTSRRLGSIALLLIGLIFYVWLQISVQSLIADGDPQIRLPMLFSLALGGLGAVVLAFRLWPSNPKSQPPEEAKNVQPG